MGPQARGRQDAQCASGKQQEDGCRGGLAEGQECWPGEELPIGLILCGEKNREQIELLQLDRSEIRVAEYLVELPPKGLREAKLHEAIRLARGQVERSSET